MIACMLYVVCCVCMLCVRQTKIDTCAPAAHRCARCQLPWQWAELLGIHPSPGCGLAAPAPALVHHEVDKELVTPGEQVVGMASGLEERELGLADAAGMVRP